jgi:hypothetical protein
VAVDEIPSNTREEMEKKMDELAREYAETHDEKVKAELEALSLRLAELPLHLELK